MDKKSKIFFIFYFIIIAFFVCLTYYTFVINKNYIIFTVPENIPSIEDFLKNKFL